MTCHLLACVMMIASLPGEPIPPGRLEAMRRFDGSLSVENQEHTHCL